MTPRAKPCTFKSTTHAREGVKCQRTPGEHSGTLSPVAATPPFDVGERIRKRRADLKLSVRELARRLEVSPSLISQIERGKASPSVGTLYALTNELRLSMDSLFADQTDPSNASGPEPAVREPLPQNDASGNGSHPQALPDSPVVHPDERRRITLDSGVRWERLTQAADPYVDFLYVEYQPGGASCEEGVLMRHSGREYGHVLSGTLELTVGFETHILGPGDSISFESTVPHRLATVGDEPVEAIWFVLGRTGDPRLPKG
jgi:transcriptional regulator with XRE-family HTH domain